MYKNTVYKNPNMCTYSLLYLSDCHSHSTRSGHIELFLKLNYHVQQNDFFLSSIINDEAIVILTVVQHTIGAL